MIAVDFLIGIVCLCASIGAFEAGSVFWGFLNLTLSIHSFVSLAGELFQ